MIDKVITILAKFNDDGQYQMVVVSKIEDNPIQTKKFSDGNGTSNNTMTVAIAFFFLKKSC